MLSRTLCEVRAGGPARAGPTLPPTSHNVTMASMLAMS
nr:MAG TPA: hypothetical protein [Caudoviricetes sp.]